MNFIQSFLHQYFFDDTSIILFFGAVLVLLLLVFYFIFYVVNYTFLSYETGRGIVLQKSIIPQHFITSYQTVFIDGKIHQLPYQQLIPENYAILIKCDNSNGWFYFSDRYFFEQIIVNQKINASFSYTRITKKIIFKSVST